MTNKRLLLAEHLFLEGGVCYLDQPQFLSLITQTTEGRSSKDFKLLKFSFHLPVMMHFENLEGTLEQVILVSRQLKYRF